MLWNKQLYFNPTVRTHSSHGDIFSTNCRKIGGGRCRHQRISLHLCSKFSGRSTYPLEFWTIVFHMYRSGSDRVNLRWIWNPFLLTYTERVTMWQDICGLETIDCRHRMMTENGESSLRAAAALGCRVSTASAGTGLVSETHAKPAVREWEERAIWKFFSLWGVWKVVYRPRAFFQ
jgi:hypothetical protein